MFIHYDSIVKEWYGYCKHGRIEHIVLADTREKCYHQLLESIGFSVH